MKLVVGGVNSSATTPNLGEFLWEDGVGVRTEFPCILRSESGKVEMPFVVRH